MPDVWTAILCALVAFLVVLQVPSLRDPVAGGYCPRCGRRFHGKDA